MARIADLLDHAAHVLARAGVAEPMREARLLLEHTAGLSRTVQIGWPEREIGDEAALRGFADALARRAAREPLSHLTGHREFWSLSFRVTKETLDPRADSEAVIESALARISVRDAALHIADFGTGTGCLLLALLHELPNAQGVGFDISPGAIATARANAERLGLTARAEMRTGDWCAPQTLGLTDASLDIVLANPPYIPTDDIAGLQPEVARHEPRRALDGGPDGLLAYRQLLPLTARLLRPSGFAVFEIGLDQRADVLALAAASGLQPDGAAGLDLAGIPRTLVFRKAR